MKKGIAESEKAIAEDKKAIKEMKKGIAESEKAIAEGKRAIKEMRKAIAESKKAIPPQNSAFSLTFPLLAFFIFKDKFECISMLFNHIVKHCWDKGDGEKHILVQEVFTLLQ